MKLGKPKNNRICSHIQTLAYTSLWNESFDAMKPELWNDISRRTWDKVNINVKTTVYRREIR